MRITLFTSNGLRHLAFIERLQTVATVLFVIQEARTLFPGQGEGIYRQDPAMREYFSRVQAAERAVFGRTRYLRPHVRFLSQEYSLILAAGEINRVDPAIVEPALESDLIIVFGSSYIKGRLCEMLVERKAINLHMGVAPEYRGADCNFWALYDGRPEYVGATIHRLSSGLDSGPILRRVFAQEDGASGLFPVDPFRFGMEAVRKAQQAIVELARSEEIHSLPEQEQDKSLTLRYSRYSDFTPEVVKKYLLGRIVDR